MKMDAIAITCKPLNGELQALSIDDNKRPTTPIGMVASTIPTDM